MSVSAAIAGLFLMQDGAAADMAACRTIEDAAARLSCFDMAICRSIEDDSERLACFDKRTRQTAIPVPAPAARAQPYVEPTPAPQQQRAEPSSTPAAPQTRPQQALPPQQARAPVSAEQRFGKPVTKEEEKIKEITAMVTKIDTRPRGEVRVYLDNGQVWDQLTSDSEEVRRPEELVSTQATVKRGVFGSFRMKLDSGDLIRVRRLR